jgi:hypothetical protein
MGINSYNDSMEELYTQLKEWYHLAIQSLSALRTCPFELESESLILSESESLILSESEAKQDFI